jgi:hypothetical protein
MANTITLIETTTVRKKLTVDQYDDHLSTNLDRIPDRSDGAGDNYQCGMCQCVLLTSRDGDEYLWVSRFVPAHSPYHRHCECHDYRSIG